MTIVAYEPVRYNGFVDYDDGGYIVENPNVKGGITADSVIWAITKGHAANWHPLTWLSHMLDCELFGLNPSYHHLMSVMLHTINALLLFWILKGATGSIWASAFVAFVFAVHPVQVESVAWASERKTILSGLFQLLTIAAYIHYARQPGTKRYLLVLLLFGLCIMTKPVVVTVPLMLLLLDYWPLERIKWGRNTEEYNATKPGLQKFSAGRLITEKIPLLVMSGILSMVTSVTQEAGGAIVTLEKLPTGYRIANMFISYIRYIGKLVWPSRLAILYPHTYSNLSIAITIICALLFIVITILCIYIGLRKRYVAVGWLWYVGTLVPMIGLIQAGSQAMANRYMYISMLGLLIIIAWSFKDLIAKWRFLKVAAAGLTIIILPILVFLTRMQVRHWQNTMTLFGYALEVTENNEGAEFVYGCSLHDSGKIKEAIQHISAAVRIRPTFSAARNKLGKILMEEGKTEAAIACFKEVIARDKEFKEAYFNLGAALGRQGKYDEAIKCFAKLLKLDPEFPDAHARMGATLLISGRADEAIEHFEEALKIKPDQAEVYANLAIAYMQLGKYESAIVNRDKAVELEPDDPDVLNNLAWLLATAGDISLEDANKSVEFAERACELTGNKKPDYLDTLAVSYAAAGRFEEAVKTAEKAFDIATANGQEVLASELQNRIKLYRAGQKYLQK